MKSLGQIHRDEGVTPEQAADAARPMTEAEINEAAEEEEKGERRPITQDQADEYVESGGCRCPLCESLDIGGRGSLQDAFDVFQEIACRDCGAMWSDIYTLTSIAGGENTEITDP